MVPNDGLQLFYTGLFGVSGAVCLGCLYWVSELEGTDVRRGLRWMLLLSAVWAGTNLLWILVADRTVAVAGHLAGLVVGLATVGAWLYFCSAFGGRTYHRERPYRALAASVYAGIVGFKLTNPWHGQYFDVAVVESPFRHVVLEPHALFWAAAAFAYMLSAVGFYIVFDAVERRDAMSIRLVSVVGLAGLPAALFVLGALTPPSVPAVHYEPLGVALFAVGVLTVARDPFFDVPRFGRPQLIENLDDPVFFLDRDGRVRYTNDAAAALSGELVDGDTLRSDVEAATGDTFECRLGGESRYFAVSSTPVAVGAVEVGRGVRLVDVTDIERQRRELERKDEQLEGFAAAVSHELRNSIGIVDGRIELAMAELDDPDAVREHLAAATAETDELTGVVENLRTLARYSQSIGKLRPVDLGETARTAARLLGDDTAEVRVNGTATVEADPDRLRELFRCTLRFLDHNGASTVTVVPTEDGFTVTADGRSLDAFDEERVFAHANAVPDAETGMLLPNVRMLATVHGWTVGLDRAHENGVRVCVSGVRRVPG